MSVERRLLNFISKKYAKPLHQMFDNALVKPTLAMEIRAQNEKKLSRLIAQLPNWGVGRIVVPCYSAKSAPTFWRITRVFVDHQSENFDYGVVWGVFTDKGRCRYYEEEISDTNEHLWRLVPKYDEEYYINYEPETKELKEVPLYVPLPPLMAQMYKMQKAKKLKKLCTDEPMVRFLFERSPHQIYKQKLDDGSFI